MGLMMFVLCVIFMASQTFTGGLFSKVGTGSTVIAILAGTILPLIPQVLGFVGDTDATTDSASFLLRLQNALRLLERQEENRNTIKFEHGLDVPNRYVPFRYYTISSWQEAKGEEMDHKIDYDPITYEPIPVVDDKPKIPSKDEDCQ
jgi:hypothetical protein